MSQWTKKMVNHPNRSKSNFITDIAARDAALADIRGAKKLGHRAKRSMSRDLSKPGNVVGIFAVKAMCRYEVHASRTTGIMQNMIYIYQDGVLAHEERNSALCAEIIALHDAKGV